VLLPEWLGSAVTGPARSFTSVVAQRVDPPFTAGLTNPKPAGATTMLPHIVVRQSFVRHLQVHDHRLSVSSASKA
jgi:hypothetical protein